MIAVEHTIEDQLGGALFAREYHELRRCVGGKPGGFLGQLQSHRIAAQRIHEAIRLGFLARPHPPLGNRLDLVLGQMAAGRDMLLEAAIGQVEKGVEPLLLGRRKIAQRTEHAAIGATLG